MKEPLKQALGHSIFASRLDALLLRDTAIVVAFHRVRNTSSGDGLTVSVPLFDRYCRFFRDHFNVVPLGDLVTRLERRLPLDRELAITFDDGYLDNFESAAPLLRKYSLPAAFFVVTRWMGGDVVPWWDRAERIRHRWMSWEQVRTLHQSGFEIGAHTRTHVDLGAVSGPDAETEIAGARADLERELGAGVDLFAYPYGARENMSEANRALIKRAGFRCCCSCFGGAVTADTDPFRLARVPINTSFSSPHGFGFEVAFGRTLLPA
jgi:peptidoglycan/xylan/chitin deacetylase (PgdA/CDA1 family)